MLDNSSIPVKELIDAILDFINIWLWRTEIFDSIRLQLIQFNPLFKVSLDKQDDATAVLADFCNCLSGQLAARRVLGEPQEPVYFL